MPEGQEAEYEGDSSLTSHADFTARMLESAVATDSSTSRCDELVAMVRNVQHINKSTSPNDAISTVTKDSSPASAIETRQPALPPVQLTLNCLRMLRGQLHSSCSLPVLLQALLQLHLVATWVTRNKC